MGVCSDYNWTAHQLQMAALKWLEMMAVMIMNRLQPTFCSQICSKLCYQFGKYHISLNEMRKPCRDSVDRTSFDFQIDDCLSNLLLKIIVYSSCVTDQPFITQSRRSVLNFKFSLLTVLRSMSCMMGIEENLCKFKIQLEQLEPSDNGNLQPSSPQTALIFTKIL